MVGFYVDEATFFVDKMLTNGYFKPHNSAVL